MEEGEKERAKPREKENVNDDVTKMSKQLLLGRVLKMATLS